MEFLIIGVVILFVFMYRTHKGESVYKFIVQQVGVAYEKFAPYSFKVMREKAKELGQEYTVRQYTMQVIIFVCKNILLLICCISSIGYSIFDLFTLQENL